MALKSDDKAALAVLVGGPVILVFTCWLGAQFDNYQKAQNAKPKPMAPCESVLDACYVNDGVGDAAWLIKQQDRMYGTRKHEEKLNAARDGIAANALCEHKQKQGYDCE